MSSEPEPRVIEIEVGVISCGILIAALTLLVFIGIVLWPDFKSETIVVPQQSFMPQATTYTPSVDTTSESFRVEQRDRMIRNGANPNDAEVFTNTLTEMEKEWKATGKVSP